MDKQLPQIAVAALADAEEPCLAAGRVLSCGTSPSQEENSRPLWRPLRCRLRRRWRSDQGTYARNLPESLAGWIGRSDLLHLFVHRDDLLLQVFPLAPQQADEVTHARVRFASAFSRISGIACFSLNGVLANTRPRSSRKARSWLITDVRRATSRSRTRCIA